MAISKEQIAKYKDLVKNSTNETVRNAAAKKLKESGISVEEKPAAKKPAAKKAAPKKAAPKKAAAKPAVKKKAAVKKKSPKKVFLVDGKEIDESDVDFCEKVLKAWKKRRALAKKAASTYRTKSVMRIITEKVADTVEKGIKSVTAAEIKKNPKAFLAKVEKLEKSAIAFLNDFKGVLGDDFKKSEIKLEFDELDKMIRAKVASFKNKK